MGKGTTTKQKNVIKVRQALNTGTGGANQASSSEKNNCTFTVKGRVELSRARFGDLTIGANVVIILNSNNSQNLDLWVDGKLVEPYVGVRLQDMIRCINSKYIYEGSVQELAEKNKEKYLVKYSVSGLLRA